MRPFLVAALDRLVGNEPGVSPAPEPASGRAPARDVRRVLIPHADGPPVKPGPAARGEMKDELLAVVEKAVAVDRLVVADGEILVQPGPDAGGVPIDRDRLDPVDDILEREAPGGLRHVHRGPGIPGFGAHVQKSDPSVERPGDRPDPGVGPIQIARAGQRVVIRAIPNTQIVGRRGYDDADGARGEAGKDLEAVALKKRRVPGPPGGLYAGRNPSRSFGGDDDRKPRPEPRRSNGMVAAVAVVVAGRPSPPRRDLVTGRNLPITASQAPTGQRREPEKANERAHGSESPDRQASKCRAVRMLRISTPLPLDFDSRGPFLICQRTRTGGFLRTEVWIEVLLGPRYGDKWSAGG